MINEGSYSASSEATNLRSNADRSLKKPSVQPFYCTETDISEYDKVQKGPVLRENVPSIYPVHTVHNQGTELLPTITPESPVHTSVHTLHPSSTEAVKALKPSDELYELDEVRYEVRKVKVENPEVEKTGIMNSMNYYNRKQKVIV